MPVGNFLFDNDGERRAYAVLDGANVPDLLDHLVADNPPNVCLYRGKLEPDIAEVAPYLVRLAKDHPFTEWLLSEGWGKSWGIFALCSLELDEVRRHFRRFLMVQDPNNEPLYFRYYDPRVLRVFLPTCNSGELTEMFGPVSCYFVEDEQPEQCLEFSVKDGALVRKQHAVPAPGAAGTSV